MPRVICPAPAVPVVALLLSVAAAGPARAQARVYRAAEMTTEQYRTLDRARTVVVLTDGILEEHGPFLPAYTDGYIAEAIVKDVARAVVAKGWNVILFPTVPLGSGGANELAAKYPFPGTFAVRLDTLRAVFMDLADELAEAGFRTVFIANNHGAPNHNRALNQVCDYFRDTHGGRMIVLRGVPTATTAKIDGELRAMLSERARAEDAGSGHAGIGETSLILHLQPALVSPAYSTAPVQTAPGFGDMITVAGAVGWPGYFGAPAHSTAAYGALLFTSWSEQAVQQALGALEGMAPPGQGFFGNTIAPPDAAALKRDESIAARQEQWLKKKGIR